MSRYLDLIPTNAQAFADRVAIEREFQANKEYIASVEAKMAAEKEAAEARRKEFNEELEARMNNSSLKSTKVDDDFIARAHAAWAKMGIK